MMLYYSNLQFTNATQLNDPFDCHQGLIDFSKATPERCRRYAGNTEIAIEFESHNYVRNRERAWICSLSKVHDSILMWSYYNGHRGICVGLNVEKIREQINYMAGMNVFNDCFDVQYRDVIDKPDYFQRENQDFFFYQMLTKAKCWEHEQEVRMFILDPSPWHQALLPHQQTDKKRIFDGKEIRTFPPISGDCFEALYLGIKIGEKEKKGLIKFARKLNPDIKVYQMQVNPDAFRLDSVEIT